MSNEYSRMFDGLIAAFIILLTLAPFGIWQLVEIIIWGFRHIRVIIQKAG